MCDEPTIKERVRIKRIVFSIYGTDANSICYSLFLLLLLFDLFIYYFLGREANIAQPGIW